MKSFKFYNHCEWCGHPIVTYKRTYAYRAFTDRGIFVICHRCNSYFVRNDILPMKGVWLYDFGWKVWIINK